MILKSSIHDAVLQEQRGIVRQLRHDILRQHRSDMHKSSEPTIRVMARIVKELESECHRRNIASAVIRTEVIDRTIGDVNVRLIIEVGNEDEGAYEYYCLADELGVALPGEKLSRYTDSAGS